MQLTPSDVNAINRLLDFQAHARANGRRCSVEMHFNEDDHAIALKLDLGAPGACYAVAYEPTVPEAIDRVLDQAERASSPEKRETDPVPGLPADVLPAESPW